MAETLKIDRLYSSLDNVTSITVSDIEEDEENAGFARRISFFTEPTEQTNRRPILEVLLRSTDEETLKIQTPTLEF